ncbi:MAG: methyltransferase domain-containing protein [Candidatus Sumerlaeia bacterium]|nr:methyltransferase domain-containing protein [Candidatus Sumerlaeia bacterium]
MPVRPRQMLEEGPIVEPLFVEHYRRFARWPSKAGARWMAAKMRALGVRPGGRVLDIGCGPGWVVRFLAGHFPAMRFVGVDASPVMLAVARRGLREDGLDGRVSFVVADGQCLPFHDATFDAVISGATLHHINDPVALLNEVDRVLTRDGHIIISDLNRALPRVLWPMVVAADWFERLCRPAAVRRLPEGFINSYRAAYTPEEIRAFLKRSPLGRRVCYYPRWLQHWIQTLPTTLYGKAEKPSE